MVQRKLSALNNDGGCWAVFLLSFFSFIPLGKRQNAYPISGVYEFDNSVERIIYKKWPLSKQVPRAFAF